MKYLYERDDWPDLRFDEKALAGILAQVYLAQGRLFGKLDVLGFDVQNEVLLNMVSDEIVTSFAIEGERLDLPGVQSSVARKLALDVAGMTFIMPTHYTEGVVEMALEATQNYMEPVTEERLFSWHSALFPYGRSGIHRINTGAYRTEDIQIVSGAIGKENVHYRGPDPGRVPAEMEAFLLWLEKKTRG